MKLAITGATGLVGRFLMADALAAGDTVLALSRPHYALGDRPDLAGCDALIHCAFQHRPGLYRGGEGDDPDGFTRANLDGTIALFKAAASAKVARVIFLSSRAVYDGYPAGTILTEDLPLAPTNLYGQVKWQAEQALQNLTGPGFSGAAIRATGIYGPGAGHKWSALFDDFLAGRPIAPRNGTELHAADLASAVRLLLGNNAMGAFNLSDILLDRHDLLTRVAAITGTDHAPPARCKAPVSVMQCDRIKSLGWQPSGLAGLDRALAEMLGDPISPAAG